MPPEHADTLPDQATSERFTIRWDTGMGCYRVSIPSLEFAEVVPALLFDRLRAENERYRRALLRIWVGDTGPAGSVAQFAFQAVHPPDGSPEIDETEARDAQA